MLGHCDFDLREICFNTRMRQFALPNTKIEGLVNSTKAHELGHVRLGHERELCAERDDMTMAMFDSPRGGSALVCGRGGSAAHLTREQHADYYASVFLVPEGQLMRLAPAADIEHAWRSGGRLSTAQLWSMVLVLSDHFEVTGALMARRLEDLGWIVRPTCGRCPCNLGFAEGFRNPISRTAEIVKKGPNLSIHPQRWLPLALD